MEKKFTLPTPENEGGAEERELADFYIKIQKVLEFAPNIKLFVYKNKKTKGQVMPEQGVLGMDGGQLCVKIGKNSKVITPREAGNWYLSAVDMAALNSKDQERTEAEEKKAPYVSPVRMPEKEKSRDRAAQDLALQIKYFLRHDIL